MNYKRIIATEVFGYGADVDVTKGVGGTVFELNNGLIGFVDNNSHNERIYYMPFAETFTTRGMAPFIYGDSIPDGMCSADIAELGRLLALEETDPNAKKRKERALLDLRRRITEMGEQYWDRRCEYIGEGVTLAEVKSMFGIE